ncbi:hypothetical protein B0T16DRAFT_393642 [Cercophora newfieldiana]|uniref:Uncharacterized protein n=1 Tax=Cercophora newfieldiana TaxID=92897 RepID=A0AA40CJN0_9PEZI|nr:hypothetical protein B0T16DRAFT_393642 [Cercophora newfieldiana]
MHFSLASVASALLSAAVGVQALPGHHTAVPSLFEDSHTAQTGVSLARRDVSVAWATEHVKDHKCKNSRPICGGESVRNLVSTLKDSGYMCSAEAGQCKQVACNKNCGVWLCNDKKERLNIPCRELGEHTEYIYTTCASRPTLPRHMYVSGTMEDEAGYRVEVGKAMGRGEMC